MRRVASCGVAGVTSLAKIKKEKENTHKSLPKSMTDVVTSFHGNIPI